MFFLPSTVNFENKIGAVGFTSRIAPFLYPVTLVKVDPVSGEPVRDDSGICVHAQPGKFTRKYRLKCKRERTKCA